LFGKMNEEDEKKGLKTTRIINEKMSCM